MVNPPLHRVAVVGAGAVGSYFGAMLAQAGHPVTLIGRAAHVEAIRSHGLRIDRGGRIETVATDASVELSAVQGADLVLFCVKSTDTDAVAETMAPYLAPGALVLSLQNGVENAATIARRVKQAVVPAVVYVATAMPEPGTVKHYGRGDLVIGAMRSVGGEAGGTAARARLQELVDFFASAKVPVRISADVMAELWSKLMVNCAYNAISGLAQAPYGRLAALQSIRELQQAVVAEVVAVARADGVELSLPGSLQAMQAISSAMPAQLSSTAQDMARSKPSEIDHLNGFVARRGRELGVATPANQALYALVKLVESDPHD